MEHFDCKFDTKYKKNQIKKQGENDTFSDIFLFLLMLL